MKIKNLIIAIALISTGYSYASPVSDNIDDKSALLIRIIGEEFVARYEEELRTYLFEGDVTSAKELTEKIKKEIGEMDCFDISDFFGNPSNAGENKEFNMSLWTEITQDCQEIMNNLKPYGGLKEQSVAYFVRTII